MGLRCYCREDPDNYKMESVFSRVEVILLVRGEANSNNFPFFNLYLMEFSAFLFGHNLVTVPKEIYCRD